MHEKGMTFCLCEKDWSIYDLIVILMRVYSMCWCKCVSMCVCVRVCVSPCSASLGYYNHKEPYSQMISHQPPAATSPTVPQRQELPLPLHFRFHYLAERSGRGFGGSVPETKPLWWVSITDLVSRVLSLFKLSFCLLATQSRPHRQTSTSTPILPTAPLHTHTHTHTRMQTLTHIHTHI